MLYTLFGLRDNLLLGRDGLFTLGWEKDGERKED